MGTDEPLLISIITDLFSALVNTKTESYLLLGDFLKPVANEPNYLPNAFYVV